MEAELGLGETGVLDVALPRPVPGGTPYARTGPAIALVPAGLLPLGALLLEARRRRTVPEVNKLQKVART
jgi:hypothetical protein